MNLASRSLGDLRRLVELEQQFEEHMGEILANAPDAGLSAADLLMTFKVVCEGQ